MAAFAKTVPVSLATKLPCNCHRIGPIEAGTGEVIAAGDACYIKNDGTVWRSSGAAANAAAVVDGFAIKDYPTVGDPITLLHEIDLSYGPSSATPGTPLYLSGTVAGGLDTATSTGGTVAIARVVEVQPNEGRPHAIIRVRRSW